MAHDEARESWKRRLLAWREEMLSMPPELLDWQIRVQVEGSLLGAASALGTVELPPSTPEKREG